MDPATGAALIKVGGSLLGGLFGSNSAKKRAARERAIALEDQRQKYVRLREAAELGGFNPLTAVETGGTGGFSDLPSGIAPLASTAILTGAVEGLADVLTSRKEAKMTEQDVRDDLMKIARETSGAGGFGGVVRSTGARALPSVPGAGQLSPPVARDPRNYTIPWVMDTVRGPFKPGQTGTVEEDVDPNAVLQHVGPLRQSFTLPDGSVKSYPVGPDPEELAAGVAMENSEALWQGLQDRWNRPGMWPIRRAVIGAQKLSTAGVTIRNAYEEWYTPSLTTPPARKNRAGRTLQSYE